MKATGVVRKLDDLGRLVIPKEIRKQYGLKEGDNIEFFIEEGRIIIQKFNTLSKFKKEIIVMCETLEGLLGNTVLFINDEHDSYNNKKPKEIFARSIRKVRKELPFENEAVFENDDNTYSGRVFPILVNSEPLGVFIIVYDNLVLSKEDFKCIKAFVEFLSRQHQ